MIYVEPDANGSSVESQVRCDDHGIIASRFAVLTTAIESALRHHYARHRRATPAAIQVTADSAKRYYRP